MLVLASVLVAGCGSNQSIHEASNASGASRLSASDISNVTGVEVMSSAQTAATIKTILPGWRSYKNQPI